MSLCHKFGWMGCAAIFVFAALAMPSLGQERGMLSSMQRFQVVAMGDRAIMLDTFSGETWILDQHQRRGAPAVWVPIQRYDQDASSTDAFSPDSGFRPEEASSTPSPDQSYEDAANRMIVEMQQSLASLEIQLAEVRQRFGENHPRVVELKSRITATREYIEEQLARMRDDTAARVNDSRVARQLEVFYEQLAALKARLDTQTRTLGNEHPLVQSLKTQIASLEDSIAELMGADRELPEPAADRDR